jgi:hypothetical protein
MRRLLINNEAGTQTLAIAQTNDNIDSKYLRVTNITPLRDHIELERNYVITLAGDRISMLVWRCVEVHENTATFAK